MVIFFDTDTGVIRGSVNSSSDEESSSKFFRSMPNTASISLDSSYNSGASPKTLHLYKVDLLTKKLEPKAPTVVQNS